MTPVPHLAPASVVNGAVKKMKRGRVRGRRAAISGTPLCIRQGVDMSELFLMYPLLPPVNRDRAVLSDWCAEKLRALQVLGCDYPLRASALFTTTGGHLFFPGRFYLLLITEFLTCNPWQ